MDKTLHDLKYLNYGICGTILYLGHAEFCPSTVSLQVCRFLALPDSPFPASAGWKAPPCRAHGCLATISGVGPTHPGFRDSRSVRESTSLQAHYRIAQMCRILEAHGRSANVEDKENQRRFFLGVTKYK